MRSVESPNYFGSLITWTMAAVVALRPIWIVLLDAGYEVTVLALGALISVNFLWRPAMTVRAFQQCLPFVLLQILFMLSMFWSIYPAATIEYIRAPVLSIILIIAGYYACASFFRSRSLSQLRLFLLICLAGYVAGTLIAFAVAGGVRPTSAKGHQAVGALATDIYLVMTIVLLMFLYLYKYSKSAWDLAGAIGAIMLILISGSRGGLLALAMIFGVATPWLFWGRLTVRKYLSPSICLLVAGLVLAIAAIPPLRSQVTYTVQRFVTAQFVGSIEALDPEARDYARTLQHLAAVEQLARHPVFGIGMNAFREVTRVEYGYPGGITSHNLVLRTWLDAGLPALAVLAWAIVAALRRSLKVVADSSIDPSVRDFYCVVFSGLVILVILAQFSGGLGATLAHWMLAAAYFATDARREFGGAPDDVAA